MITVLLLTLQLNVLLKASLLHISRRFVSPMLKYSEASSIVRAYFLSTDSVSLAVFVFMRPSFRKAFLVIIGKYLHFTFIANAPLLTKHNITQLLLDIKHNFKHLKMLQSSCKKQEENNMAKKKNNTDAISEESSVFINNYPRALCRKRASENNSIFMSIAFRLNDAWATFTLPLSMVKESTRRDGSEIQNCYNLFLGKSSEQRNISIKNADGKYEKQKMSCADIQHFILEARNAYAAS